MSEFVEEFRRRRLPCSTVDRAGWVGEALESPASGTSFPVGVRGFRFPAEVVVVAMRWYLRYGLLTATLKNYWPSGACTSITSPSTAVCNGSRRCWPTRPRFTRHSPGDRWFVDETYVKLNGMWRFVYRATEQHGQVIDVLVSARRDGAAARRFFPGR